MLRADDPRHGTTAGHYAHRRAGEPACGSCVAAKTRYEKARLVYGPRMVPAIGTRRRVQALKAMGHSGADIAARLGVTYQAVHKIERGTAERIHAATAVKIARVYEEMCMTLPTGYHRSRIRNQSAARGYVPPLGWLDIDDPNEIPHGWQYQAPDRAEQMADLDERGAGISEACRALGITRKAVENWAIRNGCAAVYSRMVAREQPDYERLATNKRAS